MNSRLLQKLLDRIGEALKTQDNRATAHPIYVVQQRHRYYGFDIELAENVAWMYEGEEHTDGPELKSAIDHWENTGEELPGWERTGYLDIWEFVQPFFTEKGAEDYIEANKHNLWEPRIFVDSAYRNYEWQTLRAILLEDE